MIEINLLPEEFKKKESRFKQIDLSGFSLENLPVIKLAGAFFGVIALITIALFLIGLYSKSNLTSLTARYERILPLKKDADTLKSQVDMINKKVRAIDELMVKRFGWSKKLSDLSDSVTPGIWLTDLTYDEKMTERQIQPDPKAANAKTKPRTGAEMAMARCLIISGYASGMSEEGTSLIGKFIKSLNDNRDFYSDFSDIELGSIKRDKIDDQEVMSFKITCFFKEDR